MPRPAGLPKTGGRKKGTPNKGTQGLQEALDLHGLDVISLLTTTLPQLTAKERAYILVDLMGYLYPKRKAVEISAQEGTLQPQVIVHLPSNGREVPECTTYSHEPCPSGSK